MKSLADATAQAEVVGRLRHLTVDVGRRWGTLTPNEMLCHLADAYELPIRGGRKKRVPFLRSTIVKWVGLYLPIHWPHGVRGPAAADPRRGGSQPGLFGADLQRVERSMTLFAQYAGTEWAIHPLFGALSRAEWMRWGYLHADHHLRQFGL